MRRWAVAAIVALLALAPVASAQDGGGGAGTRRIQVEGVTREFILAMPSRAGEPPPLVIALHGGGGGAQTMMPRWIDIARREGFVVAFPEGVGRMPGAGTWNAGGCCGYAVSSGSDDIAFIGAIIDDLSRARTVDPRRVYVAGLSNGGMLTYRVGVELSDRVAAIGIASGAMFGGEAAPSMPVPVLIIHGVRDDVVPFDGGESPRRMVARAQSLAFQPVSYAVEFWRRANGCSSAASQVTTGDVTVETYAACRGNSEVVLYRLASGGHGWPGAASSSVALERASYTEIEASEVLWTFFRRHQR